MVIPLALLLLVEEELLHDTLDGMVKFCASVKSAHCVKKIMELSHTSHMTRRSVGDDPKTYLIKVAITSIVDQLNRHVGTI
jgi:hypothetical protein